MSNRQVKAALIDFAADLEIAGLAGLTNKAHTAAVSRALQHYDNAITKVGHNSGGITKTATPKSRAKSANLAALTERIANIAFPTTTGGPTTGQHTPEAAEAARYRRLGGATADPTLSRGYYQLARITEQRNH